MILKLVSSFNSHTSYMRVLHQKVHCVLKLHVQLSTKKCTFAGSIPNGVGIFHWHNPSDRTMALGSTQPLTEMSTRGISWG